MKVVLMKINEKLLLQSLYLKTLRQENEIQLKPSLRGFSLSSSTHHSLRVLLL
jgi:type VI protein secretion system component VasK